MSVTNLRTLYLYPEPWAPTLNCEALMEYVNTVMPSLRVEVRGPFMTHHASPMTGEERRITVERLARGCASAKVHNPLRHVLNESPLPGEIAYESRRLENGTKVFGLLYDGVELMNLLAEMIDAGERRRGNIHVVFTNQLFGTWDDDDRRYHARASLYGFPSLVSTTGLVEAPAKPREFYLLKQQYTALGMDDAVDVGMKKEFSDRVLGHDDERLTDVAKGYVLQAIFHHVLGDPFCADPRCRLFNAHWQEEVIASQVGGDYELCPRHQEMLSGMNDRGGPRP